MPKRPAQHTIADQGVAEVSRILSRARWACDAVKSDYGEDLICQTEHKGFIDPHRILIQVKSTSRRLSTNNARISIAKATLVKWLSDSNIVVICIWFRANNICLYEIPALRFNLYDVDLSAAQTFNLDFSLENILNSNAADAIAWQSRIRNINRHFLETQSFLDDLNPGVYDSKDEYLRDQKEAQQGLFSITTKFLMYLDLIRAKSGFLILDTAALVFEPLYLGAMAPKKEGIAELKLNFDEIILMIILLRARRIMPEGGVPSRLLDASIDYYRNAVHAMAEQRGLLLPREPASKKKFEREVETMARKMWAAGSQLDEESVLKAIESQSLDSLSPGKKSRLGDDLLKMAKV